MFCMKMLFELTGKTISLSVIFLKEKKKKRFYHSCVFWNLIFVISKELRFFSKLFTSYRPFGGLFFQNVVFDFNAIWNHYSQRMQKSKSQIFQNAITAIVG